jgi:hypothetical protein
VTVSTLTVVPEASASGTAPAAEPTPFPPTKAAVMTMHAITIQAPWTVPILLGSKDVENRRRCTSHRGPLALHVSRTWCPIAAADPRIRQDYTDAIRLPPTHPHHRAAQAATIRGSIVAIAVLTDCHYAHPGCCESDWAEPDAWHLLLRNVAVLPQPLPARGALGVWALPSGPTQRIAHTLAGIAAQRESRLTQTSNGQLDGAAR